MGAVSSTSSQCYRYPLAIGRILLGFVFLWAFLDKTFGFGFATPPAMAWVHGGSPTTGFLGNVEGLFAGLFGALAGNLFIDWLFMLGLLGLGVALLLGAGVRIAAVAGSLLLGLMWLASLPIVTNPLVDQHLIYITLLWTVALSPQVWSVSVWWRRLPAVASRTWLW